MTDDLKFNALDQAMMARALRLAAQGRYWARPNPHVGCVIALGESVIGEGFTQPAGGAHAEVMALGAAGDSARGATAYVTLEPCAHHGRTPPCADALVAAGVARVVVALEDPNPLVSGNGVQRLREAGVAVDVGLQAAAVEEQLAGFLARHRRGRGRLRIKMASSADGRTAMASGESQWITGPAARRDVQRLRAESCAIVTGIGTVLEDNCALTVRDAELPGLRLPEPERRALRVVLDSSLRTPPGAAVLSAGQGTLLVHDERAEVPEHLRDYPRLPLPEAGGGAAGGANQTVGDGAAGLPLRAVLEHLAERECNEILLESGAALAGAVLREGLADELLLYQAPKLLGSRARPLFDLPLDQMGEALEMTLLERRHVGADLMQRFRLGTVILAVDTVF